jgi:hypothetical protein
MKAKIIDVKKIVRSQSSSGKGSSGKAPKNIEGWEEEEEDSMDGDSDGDDGDSEKDPNDPQGGKGSGSGDLRNSKFKEIDPADPGSTYTVTPWQKPAGKSVVGEVLPAGSLGDGDAEDRDSEAKSEKWKELTKTAEQQSRGNMPGGIRGALERMRTPIIDWRKELEAFIDDAVSKSKYILPSRRFLGGGKAQYGYKRYKEDFESMVIAIDTSGSISEPMVEQFLAEVRAIVESNSPQDLYIIYCHTSIYRVDHIEPGDPIEVGTLRTGGTEFYPPFKWTEENLLDMGIVPSVFIYFTDGDAAFPSASQYGISEYDDRAIWVLLTWNGMPFSGDVPFGNRIDITLPNKEIKSI